ncbi:restriction endonuclease subunit S [Agathobacter sp.]|uniref:restriction endonuclease subunit S n=1 Tax=Agathobacter sp. TaxID=2021311 RepID=UPI003AB70385
MKIKDICTSVTDGSHNPPQGIEKSEYMMLSSKNIFDDEITFDEPRFLSEKDFEREHKRTQIAVGDVLLTIVGTVGRTAVVDEDMPAFALQRSVAVLHPKNDVCLPRFLMYALRGKRTYIENRAKGVAQKGIYLKEVSDIDIYIPDISNQEIIINKLDKVNTIIKLRQEELLALDNLIKARFVEMFGDPVSNSYGFPEATLPELGELGRGVSKHRPRNDSKLLGGDYPLIQTGDVANAGLYITSYGGTYSELGLKQSKMWNKGTLCITIAANIAKTAILEFDACFPDSVVGFIANEKTNNIFIHYWFSFFQAILESQAPESAQKNINLKILSELKVIVPKKEKQDEFVEFIEQVYKSKVAVQKALDETQKLFDSLMQEYFN